MMDAVSCERLFFLLPSSKPFTTCTYRTLGVRLLMQGDENSTAAIYGMASSMPAGPVNVLLRAYTDVTLGS